MEKSIRCDRRVSAQMQGKVYKTMVRTAMLFGLKTVALRSRQEAELEVADMKIMRFSLGATRIDRIRNKYIRGTAHVRGFGDTERGQTEMIWTSPAERQ